MTDPLSEPLREAIRRHDLRADKRLGQNFLLDDNLLMKIARAAGPWDDAAAYEVGPGPGGLTRALIRSGARPVMAVERDARFLPHLQEMATAAGGALHVVAGDALEVEEAGLFPPGGRVRIAANLPYNVATPLIVCWLAARPLWWVSATVMVQREVADRMTASPGGKAYGRLAVLLAANGRAERLFDVSPAAFSPPPKVTSSVVRIEPTTPLEPAVFRRLEAVTAAAFGQRRKMLRAAVKAEAARYGLSAEDFLALADIDPTLRAEAVPTQAFVALARASLSLPPSSR